MENSHRQILFQYFFVPWFFLMMVMMSLRSSSVSCRMERKKFDFFSGIGDRIF
jgi:hypothetical protein